MKLSIFALIVIMICSINSTVAQLTIREPIIQSDSIPNDYRAILSGKIVDVIPLEDYYQEAYLLVNNVLITDSLQIKTFHKKYGYDIKKGKYLNQAQALTKYKINNKAGLYVYDMKKNIIIILPQNDYETR